MDSPLGKLKVAELKERLEAAGLSTKGVKKDLIDRLDEYERSTQNVPAKDEPPKQQSPSPKRTRSSPSKLQHDSVMEDSVPTTTPPSSTNGTGTVAQKRKVDNYQEESSKKHKPVEITPSTTNTVLLKNLVRPFTVQALKILMAEFGESEKFWLDSIKTHCFMTYSLLECAAKAQSNLHGLQWPERTGRQLTAEFISAEQAETLIKLDNGSGRRPSQSAIAVGASTAAAAPTGIRSLFARATKAAVDSTAKAREQALEQHQQQLAANEAAQAESPDAVSEAAQEEMYKPPPAVNIDLLYRRTVTKPEIYYLPLTDEQVAEKKREIST